MKLRNDWMLCKYVSRRKEMILLGVCFTAIFTLEISFYHYHVQRSYKIQRDAKSTYNIRIWRPPMELRDQFHSPKLCPQVPFDITERLTDFPKSAIYFPITELPNVGIGGIYRPKECVSLHKAAIIIPYRDRDEHLKVFLGYIHPFLQRQHLEYAVFAVEQDQEHKFNRAALMNVGFLEALKQDNFSCFIFHDVDLLPESDLNIYGCSIYPRQLVHSTSEDGYEPKYKTNFGGVTAITKGQMLSVNGYSNEYYGWGGEDDNFFERFVHNGYPTYRNPSSIGKYWELSHNKSAQTNVEQQSLLRPSYFEHSFYWKDDGLSTIKYHIRTMEKRKLCTYFLVNLPKEKAFPTLPHE